MEFWIVGFLDFKKFGILEFSNSEMLEACGNFGNFGNVWWKFLEISLIFPHFVGNLEIWIFGILEILKFGTLEFGIGRIF